MSDNIPFDIQMEIIKKVSNVKSLFQFRSVSKPWKLFIDSSTFIKGYGARHTQPHSRILTYYPSLASIANFIFLVDDDIKTFKVKQQETAPFVMSPLLKQYRITSLVGSCHGLLCFYGFNQVNFNWMFVIWNPSIGKSFGIAAPDYDPQIQIKNLYGFAVCPVTSDPTVIKILCADNMPWHVEVFTLSYGVWNVIPSANFPHQSIKLDTTSQVVIDRFIYWGAHEKTNTYDGESTTNHMVVSFDLITKEFKVVHLPDGLTKQIYELVSISKLRGSLVVYGFIDVAGAECCDVWVMEHGSSFRNLFTTRPGIPYYRILGFKNNGETIFEIQNGNEMISTLVAYDPFEPIMILGISGFTGSFFMGSYKESLLLLDHSDLHIYCNDNQGVD